MTLTTKSLEETLALGRLIGQLAPAPPAQTCIALEGALGAGKTQLTRGIAEGAGVDDPSLVSSPTYVLLNIYPGKKPVYHLDAYRIASEEDFRAVGLDELLGDEGGGGIVVLEWASRVRNVLPEDCLLITMEHGEGETQRAITVTGQGPRSERLASELWVAWRERQIRG